MCIGWYSNLLAGLDDTYFFEAMPLTASAALMLFAGNLERVACPNIHTSQASDDD
ncbi:MAG: hypothetical protein Q4E48_05365 [Prevotella sp.]|nr:hypothetical protein [Prevotella sp.]